MSTDKGISNKQGAFSVSEKKSDVPDEFSDYYKIMDAEDAEQFCGEISIPRYIGIGSWCSSSVVKSDIAEENPLSYLESSLLICVLQDAIDELIILKYVIGAPLVACNLTYRTPKEKYTRKLTPVRIFPEVENTPVFTSAVKLQRDRASIETIFGKVIKSLMETRSYDPLINFLRGLKSEEEDDTLLIEEFKNNLLYMKNLKIKLEEKRKVDELEEKEREELMYQLQDELDGVALKCEVEEKFVNKWEDVRYAQNQWKLSDAETALRNSIADFTQKMNLERRVTYEIQSYLKICQTELEEKLEDWMTKYDSETERRESKLLHLKYERDQQEEKKHELQKMYEERTTEMKKWLEFKRIRKMRAEASLTIQSWWRGIIVRKKLSLKKAKKPPRAKKEKGNEK